MFVIAIAARDGAHRFYDGEDHELKIGYEWRIDNVSCMRVETDVEGYHLVKIEADEGYGYVFDADYWDIHAVSEKDSLFED